MVRLSRVSLVHLALALFAVALVARLAQVQLVQGKDWAEKARRQQFRNGAVAAPRGNILDASGNILVESRELVRLSVAPREVQGRAALASEMRRAGFDPSSIGAATDTSRVWVVLPGLHVASDVTHLVSLAGMHAEVVLNRENASSGGLRRIVGRLDSEGRALDGIELALDSVLRGDTARATVARDSRGRKLDTPGAREVAPQAGSSVTLTINRDLQEITERALARATDSLRASGGDIVVMNPHTGEVLAMASLRLNARSFANTAITEPFEPGSTLKPFIVAALLERKLARPDEMIETMNGEMVLNGRRIIDLHKSKSLSLADVIRHSSNIGIVRFADRLSPREKFEMLRDIGLGAPTGVPLPAETDGTLREPARWSRTSAASLVMGYELAVTPLQLVAAYAAIANGGELMEPHIVKELRRPDGALIYRAKPRVVRRVFSTDVAEEVQRMLRSVVDSGTAMKADLATFQLAGKSGTARRTVEGRGYVAGNYTASFVGLFPGDRPQYVVLVKLDSPRGAYYGGEIAAPVTSIVLRAALAARDAALDREGLTSVARAPRTDSLSRPGIGADEVGISAERADAERTDAERAGRAGVADLSQAEVEAAVERTPRPPVIFRLPFTKQPAPFDRPERPVPDVAGLPVRKAVHALHDAGFRVKLVKSQSSPTVPLAGTLLPPGTTVRLQHIP